MFNGKVQVLSRALQVLLIVGVIIFVFVLLLNRNSIEAGRNYQLLEGSYIAQSQEEMIQLDQARRTRDFKKVLDTLEVEQAGPDQRVMVLERDGKICKIDNGGRDGYISCQSLIK